MLGDKSGMDFKDIISFFLGRARVLLSLCIVTPLGFWLWRYDGLGRLWFNFYATGALYEIFWCLVVFFFWPQKKNITKIVVGVLVATCLLEVLQLWHPIFLEKIRTTFIGKALISTCFVWWQFPHYALGSLIGWLWLWILSKKMPNSS